MYANKPLLEVDTNDKTDEDLDYLSRVEDPDANGVPLNKSTLINRAVQMYAEVVRAQQRGDQIWVGPARANASRMTWI